jgi:hypothetical protein
MNTQDIVPLAVTVTSVGIGLMMMIFISWRMKRVSKGF